MKLYLPNEAELRREIEKVYEPTPAQQPESEFPK
jgi:hypothetical protein